MIPLFTTSQNINHYYPSFDILKPTEKRFVYFNINPYKIYTKARGIEWVLKNTPKSRKSEPVKHFHSEN